MKKLIALGALAAVALFDAQPGFPQPIEVLNALKKEIQSLKEGQVAIQKDIQEIKNLLRARAAPAPPAEQVGMIVSVDGAPFKGEKTAKLTLIDFSDYQ